MEYLGNLNRWVGSIYNLGGNRGLDHCKVILGVQIATQELRTFASLSVNLTKIGADCYTMCSCHELLKRGQKPTLGRGRVLKNPWYSMLVKPKNDLQSCWKALVAIFNTELIRGCQWMARQSPGIFSCPNDTGAVPGNWKIEPGWRQHSGQITLLVYVLAYGFQKHRSCKVKLNPSWNFPLFGPIS